MDAEPGRAGVEPEGTQLGVGAEGGERGEAPARRRLNHPIVERNGVEFYAITRYHGDREWIDYQPVEGDWMGNGVADVKSPVLRAKMALGRDARNKQKAERAFEYEDRVYAALDSVANLQRKIVDLANDEGVELDKLEMEKLRLGLAAGESILNRALGKAVTKIDADVTHNVADQIATIDAEWEIEED